MFLVITGILISGFYTCYGGYYVKPGVVTWKEANSTCKLATPELNFNGNVTTIANVPANNDVMWVGYVQTPTALLYVGCSDVSDVSSVNNFTNVELDLGVCYSLCTTTPYIGLSPRSTCYCLHTIPANHTSFCGHKCIAPLGTLCGDMVSSATLTRVSIYKKIHYPSSNNDQLNEPGQPCRAFEPYSQTYFWKRCSAAYTVMCSTNDRIIYGNNTLYRTWDKTILTCLKNRSAPVSDQQIHLSVPLGSEYWTGVIQVNVTLSLYNEYLNKTGGSFKVGYAEWTGGDTMKLRFDNNNNAKKRMKALCNEGSGPHTSYGIRTELSSKGYNSITTTHPVHTNVLSTSNGDINTRLQDSEEPGLKNFVAVYVIVPIVVIVLVIVIAGIVVYLRRKRSKGRNYSSHSSEIDGNEKRNHGSANMDTGGHDREPAHDLTEYSECSYAHNNQSQSGDTDGDSYYDTTNMKQKNPPPNTDNIYNKLEGSHYNTFKHVMPVNDDTYNHVTQNRTANDDTYNHIMQKHARSDDTYNPMTYKSLDKDDTYNHVIHSSDTRDGRQTRSESDNTYNHVVKKIPENDDTYSHPMK